MKILIGYDGSNFSEAALGDLARAGLPEECEVWVLSVAEVWLPQNGLKEKSFSETNKYVENLAQKYHVDGRRAIAEAATFARHAQKRLRKEFRKWNVSAESAYGSPAWEILKKAEVFEPNLIVLGSHGRSAVGRLFLGSISNKVLTEAHCSVRIARSRIEAAPSQVRLVIGFDGSKGALATVNAVASRNWRKFSKARLVAAVNSAVPSAIGRFVSPTNHLAEEINQSERIWLKKLAGSALRKLNEAGLEANLHVQAGNPKHILVEEAERWSADCIFIGANAFGSRMERVLLGSVSAAVAARARCSVEVVRKNVREAESGI